MIESTIPSEYVDLANVQASEEQGLLDKDHVVGVALGHKISQGEDTGDPAVTVLVDVKLDRDLVAPEDIVPARVGDALTDVQEVGTILASQFAVDVPAAETAAALASRPAAGLREREEMRARDGDGRVATPQVGVQALTQRVRPAMGGYSCGHPSVTAGTIASACRPASPFPGIPSRYFLLSNNHVTANSNFANIGDPTLQPGPADGGTVLNDTIGRLAAFVPLQYMTAASAPLNLVDAAISEVPFHSLDRAIYYIGHVRRIYTAPTVGDIVQKTGRTTNYSTGRVTNINATVDVGGYKGGTARFAQQIITTPMSAGGDSGSLVTSLEEEGVGLLFAGSSAVTIVNHLHFVQALLGVRITEL